MNLIYQKITRDLNIEDHMVEHVMHLVSMAKSIEDNTLSSYDTMLQLPPNTVKHICSQLKNLGMLSESHLNKFIDYNLLYKSIADRVRLDCLTVHNFLKVVQRVKCLSDSTVYSLSEMLSINPTQFTELCNVSLQFGMLSKSIQKKLSDLTCVAALQNGCHISTDDTTTNRHEIELMGSENKKENLQINIARTDNTVKVRFEDGQIQQNFKQSQLPHDDEASVETKEKPCARSNDIIETTIHPQQPSSKRGRKKLESVKQDIQKYECLNYHLSATEYIVQCKMHGVAPLSELAAYCIEDIKGNTGITNYVCLSQSMINAIKNKIPHCSDSQLEQYILEYNDWARFKSCDSKSISNFNDIPTYAITQRLPMRSHLVTKISKWILKNCLLPEVANNIEMVSA